jgi:hypothetical protein
MPLHLGRRHVVISVAVVCGVPMIAACGSSSKPSSPRKSASTLASAGVKFSDCMRSQGVPNFPDPTGSGGHIRFKMNGSSGSNPSSPTFQAAQKTCGKLLPGGGFGSQKPSAATEKQMLAAAQCLRAHGVSGFPDPTTPPPPGPGLVLVHNGVAFVIPSTINIQSPTFTKAAITCNQLWAPGAGGAVGATVKRG